jgi:hypothetical protein
MEFALYMKSECSFQLVDMVFDNSHIGDQHMAILNEALVYRYATFWEV